MDCIKESDGNRRVLHRLQRKGRQLKRRTAPAIDRRTNEESSNSECSIQKVQRLESSRSKEGNDNEESSSKERSSKGGQQQESSSKRRGTMMWVSSKRNRKYLEILLRKASDPAESKEGTV